MVLSLDPVASNSPVWLNAAQYTLPRWCFGLVRSISGGGGVPSSCTARRFPFNSGYRQSNSLREFVPMAKWPPLGWKATARIAGKWGIYSKIFYRFFNSLPILGSFFDHTLQCIKLDISSGIIRQPLSRSIEWTKIFMIC